MCGVVGIVRSESFSPSEADLQRALNAIRHRGPDDEGAWSEEGVWLGHRRLSIVDLTPAGRQPMISSCGRYVITFNGEIYNYPELRSELEQRKGTRAWRGTSDTEVFLELIAADGVEKALAKANGMFAFAVWDRHEKRLQLARDRFGEKPLYYCMRGGGFAFASELSALEQLKDLQTTVSPETVAVYFVRGYFPAPHTIYERVRKLPPGCLLAWRQGQEPLVKSYWSIEDVVRETSEDRARSRRMALGEAVQRLDELVQKATALRMTADVPLGVFLSGGVDSSIVAAAMQKHSSRPITTFTLGFEDPRYNEAEHARAVARHLNTNHIEEMATADQALQIVARLGRMFDEPLADDSQIPTYLVSEMARRHVTVALSGDGGDELFGGYRRYAGTPALWRRMQFLPFRGVAPAVLRTLPPAAIDVGLGFLKGFARKYGPGASVGRSLQRIARWMPARSLLELHERSLERWPRDEAPLNGASGAIPPWPDEAPAVRDDIDALCWHDQRNYLPGDILTKVDRASMAVSLETRIPLLDPEIARFAWSLPTHFRVRGGIGKRILREVLKRHVPAHLFERPKTGFSPPLEAWLLGPLRAWAEDLVSPARLKRQGLLDVRRVRSFWRRYTGGGTLEDSRAWAMLSFQDWMAARGM